MIGSAVGSFGGGLLSEALGGSYNFGAFIGGIVGGIGGGAIYSGITGIGIGSNGLKNVNDLVLSGKKNAG